MAERWMMRALALAICVWAVSFGASPALAYVVMTCTPGGGAGGSRKTDALKVECGGKYNLCGYRDRDGKLVIDRQFEVAFRFTDGLAGVRIDGKFGFIDGTGKLVIPATFDLVGSFTNGLAEVLVDGKAGVIDREGKTVVVPAWARDSRGSTFGRDAPGRKQATYWQFDLSIGSLSTQPYTLRYFDDLARGFIWASTGADGFGLLRSDGGWQVVPQYRKVEPLFQDFATVCVNAAGNFGEAIHETCGAVDRDGHLAVPARFGGIFQWRALGARAARLWPRRAQASTRAHQRNPVLIEMLA